MKRKMGAVYNEDDELDFTFLQRSTRQQSRGATEARKRATGPGQMIVAEIRWLIWCQIIGKRKMVRAEADRLEKVGGKLRHRSEGDQHRKFRCRADRRE